MPTVTLPKLSNQKKAVFAEQGLKIIEEITVAQFEKVVTGYLDRHNVLHLSTCRNNEPRSTTVEYFNQGLTVYILSEGGGKVANIRENPKVSYTIADPYHPAKDFFSASGLQVWGTANCFRKEEDPEKFTGIYALSSAGRNLDGQGLEQKAGRVNFAVITIAPERIRYLNYREGFRRAMWEK